MNLEMEGCRFEGCGWQTSAYGAFNLQSFDKDNGVSYDQVDRAIFRNCTFSNDNDGMVMAGVTFSMLLIWINLSTWNIRM